MTRKNHKARFFSLARSKGRITSWQGNMSRALNVVRNYLLENKLLQKEIKNRREFGIFSAVQHQQHQQQLQQFQQENSELQQQILQLQQELEELKNKFDRLQVDHDSFFDYAAEVELENIEMEKTIKLLKNKNRSEFS